MANRHDNRGRRARVCLGSLTRWPPWPFHFETDPVTPGETLLRTIPNSKGYYTREDGIQRYSFEPRPSDDDGISLYRFNFLTAEKLASDNTHAKGVWVTAIPAQAFFGNGLTILPTPSELPGHVSVPELNHPRWRSADKAGKIILKDWTVALAHAADLIYGPTAPRPTS